MMCDDNCVLVCPGSMTRVPLTDQKSLPAVAVPLLDAYLNAMGSTLGADSVTVKMA